MKKDAPEPLDLSTQERQIMSSENTEIRLLDIVEHPPENPPSLENELENDFVIIEREGTQLDKETYQSMLKKLTKADLEKVETFQDYIDLIHKLAPNKEIPKETGEAMAKMFGQLKKSKQGSNSGFYLQLALSIAGGAAAAYFGGPIAAIVARGVYTKAYSLLFGVPLWYQPSYWLVFMPGREHVGAFAYKFGSAVIGPASSGIFYGVLEAAKYIGGKTYTAGEYLYNLSQGTAAQPLSAQEVKPLVKAHEDIEEGWLLVDREEQTVQVQQAEREENKENLDVSKEKRTPPLKLQKAHEETKAKTEKEKEAEILQSPRDNLRGKK